MTHSDHPGEVEHADAGRQGALPPGEVEHADAGRQGALPPVEVHHEPDRPEDWGWHAESGKVSRVGGVIVAGILLVMLIGNDIGHIAKIWLISLAAGLLLIVFLDHQRRKNSWRNK